MSTPLDRARARLASRTRRLAALKKKLAAAKAAVAQTTRTIKRLAAQSKAGPWMPGVAHDPVTSIGASTVGAKGGVLHTTEGLDFAAMDRVLKDKSACPHFLVGTSGQIKQYRPLPDAATALENPPGGVETNRKRVVQIEVCGFAAKPNWPVAQKKAVAKVDPYLVGAGDGRRRARPRDGRRRARPHTDGELRDLWAGVDPEAARLMTESSDRKEP
jgi:hypothetical protein